MSNKTNTKLDPKTAAFNSALKAAYRMRYESLFNGKSHSSDQVYQTIFDAGYDHAAAELRWIPVSERLPKPKYTHLSVQVWISAIFGSERVYDTASFYQGEWANAEGSLFEDGLQITHWMPIQKLDTEPADNIEEGV